jgi:hypothetical protein
VGPLARESLKKPGGGPRALGRIDPGAAGQIAAFGASLRTQLPTAPLPSLGFAMATATYTRRTPEQGVLYQAFVQEWPIIRAASRAANDGGGLPASL